jgi:hypothetical protein
MIVDYSPATGLALIEATDFKAFKLRVRDTEKLRPTLDNVTFIDDCNVLIDIDAVTRLPGAPNTEAWNAGYRKMIDYAATKGWIDVSTNSIRAHVERLA